MGEVLFPVAEELLGSQLWAFRILPKSAGGVLCCPAAVVVTWVLSPLHLTQLCPPGQWKRAVGTEGLWGRGWRAPHTLPEGVPGCQLEPGLLSPTLGSSMVSRALIEPLSMGREGTVGEHLCGELGKANEQNFGSIFSLF